jgi:dTDP-4-amino-4,6-dideoxygalactose transaminase
MPFDVPFIKPRFPTSSAVAADFDEIVASNWYSNFGPKERQFSERIESYVGQGVSAVTVANATIGLMALLHTVLGRGDGTRFVVVPSFTFAAGPEAIEWCGYRPLFIDIDGDTLQPLLSDALAAVSDHDVAGILLGNSFGIGNPAISEWEHWAESAGLPLMVDSAAGFGSEYADGRRLGATGVAEVFSFHATKPFAIGEGGAIVTRDASLAADLRAFQNFGFGQQRQAVGLGLNGKLSELAAAIGLRQFDDFDASLERRRAVLEGYRSSIDPAWSIPEGASSSSVCFATVVAPDAAARDAAFDRLTSGGIEVRRYYEPAVHRHLHFDGSDRIGGLRVTDDVSSRVLSLPVHDELSDGVIARIADLVNGSGAP